MRVLACLTLSGRPFHRVGAASLKVPVGTQTFPAVHNCSREIIYL